MGMVNPDTLVDAIVAALRSNHELVRALNGSIDNIIPYYVDYTEEGTNRDQTLFDQTRDTIIVYWVGTRTGNFNKMESIKHDFGISIRPRGRVAAVWLLIRDGVCVLPHNMKFKHTQVDDAVRVPEEMQCRIRTEYISERFGLFDFTDVLFTLTERGIDD